MAYHNRNANRINQQPAEYRDRVQDPRVLLERRGKTLDEIRADHARVKVLLVTTSVDATREEHAEWRAFVASYGLDLQTLLARGARLLIETVRDYPHTPIARDLTAPRKESERWDKPVKPL